MSALSLPWDNNTSLKVYYAGEGMSFIIQHVLDSTSEENGYIIIENMLHKCYTKNWKNLQLSFPNFKTFLVLFESHWKYVCKKTKLLKLILELKVACVLLAPDSYQH